MKATWMLAVLTAWGCGSFVAASLPAEEIDHYRCLRYPTKLAPDVGRDVVDQEGGPNATGYRRRTVQWWPRKGQDIVDVPEGAPLRVWTRNKGQHDPEALAGLGRNWTRSDAETFKAHLIGLRGFGVPTRDPRHNCILAPAAIVRMENGERRAILAYPPFHRMVSQADHDFIYKIWEKEWAQVQASVSQDEYVSRAHFNKPMSLVLETKHLRFQSDATTPYDSLWWVRPHEPEKERLFRKASLEFGENMWTHIEASGSSMPYWRHFGEKRKYVVNVELRIGGGYAGGGFGTCGLRDNTGGPRNLGLSHEFYHGHPGGGWSAGYFGESICHGGRHFNIPGETMMFSANFCYPWRNANCTQYQSLLWFFALGDSPDWGYGMCSVAGCLASAIEPTPYHTIARLGQRRGLWKNGIRGFGDSFGQYAARMATCDFVMQYPLRSKYGMPEMSYLQPVYGRPNCYRIPNAEAPRIYGFNLVRLVPEEDATELTVDLHGFHELADHSDWRACIVAVDGDGRARYSPLWNCGKMTLARKPDDRHYWLTVAATPTALPLVGEPGKHDQRGREDCWRYLAGIHAPRYPWEVTLDGCRPGSPHRRQGDVINLDELYAINNGNKYMGYAVKHEVPIPRTDERGPLAQEKLADMLQRVKAARAAQQAKIDAGEYDVRDWWQNGKIEVATELTERIEFLQRCAKGRRHPNGGGYVSENAHVAETAYVGPCAMVLDGARVEDHACIHEHAVVHGPKTVVRGHAKIGGKAWVFGDITVGGNARILETATVTTAGRARAEHADGQGTIDGNAVIKGDHILRMCEAPDQHFTGDLVMDYTPGSDGVVGYGDLVCGVLNLRSGTFDSGRIVGRVRQLVTQPDHGGLYANWQFNQPKASLMEDSYVNNNGILHGQPGFQAEGGRRFVAFNGKDQWAEAPASVADFAELTIDASMNWSDGAGRLFDFGTGDGECFYLEIDKTGKLTLAANHAGKRLRLTGSQRITANAWTRVRVAMDGSTAAIYIDGKEVAKGNFAFRPRSVFPGDRPEGNFIACGRNRDKFFRGQIDHFRIYRKVHDDFDALGPVPFALTRFQEWSEADQQRADAWDGRRRAKEAELKGGKYGQMQDEIQQIERQKIELQKTPRLAELEERIREAERARQDLDREMQEAFRAEPKSAADQKEIDDANAELREIEREIRESDAYVTRNEAIRDKEKRRGEIEKSVRESPTLVDLRAKVDAAAQTKRDAEERIRKLPELADLTQQQKDEKDHPKRRALQEKHNQLFTAKRLGDSDWAKAEVVYQRLRRTHDETLRNAIQSNAQRSKLEEEIRRLRDELHQQTAKLRESHPQWSKIRENRSAKEKDLRSRRDKFFAAQRARDAYKKAEAAVTAAKQAVDQQKKRIAQRKSKELAALDAKIEKLRQQSKSLWDTTLRSAHLLGRNPWPGRDAETLRRHQRSLDWRTTAEWDERTREEVNGKVTPTMKEWLLRVRGY